MVSALSDPQRDLFLEGVELQLLLDALLRIEGTDFRDFEHMHLKRRVAERMRAEGVERISALLDRVVHDPAARAELMLALADSRRRLFAGPELFLALRETLVPVLRTYSFIRIWFPASGSGADPYALACLLDDAGLLDRCVLYATTLTRQASEEARQGVFQFNSSEELRVAFAAAGLFGDLRRFGEIVDTTITFGPRIREQIMFAQHQITVGGSINEFHAIVARKVLPLFNATAQYEIHRTFFDSLTRLGYLCLGRGEGLDGTVHENAYSRVASGETIYRRIR